MRGKISQDTSMNFFTWFAVFTTIISITIAIESSLKVAKIYERAK
jgi:hypothetical protein